MNEFQCAVCGQTFRNSVTETEMNREFLNSGISITDSSELLSACDGCYQLVMRRARELGLLDKDFRAEPGAGEGVQK